MLEKRQRLRALTPGAGNGAPAVSSAMVSNVRTTLPIFFMRIRCPTSQHPRSFHCWSNTDAQM
jgi:hypothetical protein